MKVKVQDMFLPTLGFF